ncbi:type II secretion system F family protein [Thermogutta sp.]|uniref:type II secretion system F family protein n=1 Tax=Thermogutta sp. TaxID=1962930 RepID=UPI00321F7D11
MVHPTLLIAIAVFVGVSALVVGAAMLFGHRSEDRLQTRLEMFTRRPQRGQEGPVSQKILAESIQQKENFLDRLLEQFPSIYRLIEQADVPISPGRLLLISLALMAGALVATVVFRLPWVVGAIMGPALGCLPILWLLWRRKRRLKAFAAQLPEALDMLARSLRAGQSLASGFGLVAREVPAPLGKEFGRVFDEQNLGVPLEESLRDLADRIPNMDLKFFATAVVLQRQTGGDLAEILDRISSLIRERFNIWGQVQALTGEGRLSGIVLMALPIVIFLAVYYLNRDYVMMLFTDPLGKKMLATAIVMQVIGALVVRKIVNIKV